MEEFRVGWWRWCWKLNLDKTELLFMPRKDRWTFLSPSRTSKLPTARNLAVGPDDQLSCNANITSVAGSCRIALYNIRKIRPFLTRGTAQILVQALVITRLDYCNSLLAGLPNNLNNQALTTHPERSSTPRVQPTKILPCNSPLFRDLHWLPVIARVRFKTLVLTLMAVSGTVPTYLQTLVRPHGPARVLLSITSTGRTGQHRSLTTGSPLWWNELPADIKTAELLTSFRKTRLETHLFRVHLDST